jgi:biopolymer transport protein ExbD
VKLRGTRPGPPDINLTPLIDVVFLLLIFFMVSTTFKDDARLRLQLPEASGEPADQVEVAQIEVAIDQWGRYYVNDDQVVDQTLETLQRVMAEKSAGQGDLPVLIKADAKTPHQAVMRALDAAAQLGLTRVGFAASLPQTVRSQGAGPAGAGEITATDALPAEPGQGDAPAADTGRSTDGER